MTLTRAQRGNLRKLADYLESLPEDYAHFGMGAYLVHDDHDAALHYAKRNGGVASCGTAACAVGHGPAAGILFRKDDFWTSRHTGVTFPEWDVYAERFVPRLLDSDLEWIWAFSGNWDDHDNHHWGAAARVRYLLKHGTPPDDFRHAGDCMDAYRAFDKRYAVAAA